MTTKPITGYGQVMIQSRFGTQGNFEMVAEYHPPGLLGSGLGHYWRNNDDPPTYPWSLPTAFGADEGAPELLAPTMIESNFGSPGNLEVICVPGSVTGPKWFVYFWRDSGPTFTWNGPFSLEITPPQGVTGNPVLIQSRFGTQGNFELVTPVYGGGLAHLWRNNDDPSYPWSAPTLFGAALGEVDGVTFVQSNFGSPGNLEVICSVGSGGSGGGLPNQLYYFWRDSGPTFTWNGPFSLPMTGVTGFPVLIQSRFGTQGNFELVAAMQDGGLAHFWRNNDDPSYPWSGPTLFGGELGQVGGVTMIQSNFGDPGNLAVICGSGLGQLNYFWRDSGPTFTWHGPYPLVSTT
jgi:hypothetical protein